MASAPASAAIITKDFNFTGVGFHSLFGGGVPPTDPVIGSVTITFDTNQSVSNRTTGITLNSLNLALGSAISFSYFAATNGLLIGGANLGTNTLSVGTDDFVIDVSQATTNTPMFNYLTYTLATQPTKAYQTFTVSPTVAGAGGVPEPHSWVLAIIGFGGIGAMLRRRGRATSVAV